MRNQVLCSVLGMAALFLVNGCQKPVVDPPTLKLDKTEFAAKAEGEVVSVPYTLANAVEGSEVSVNSVVEGGYGWAEVTRISASAIDVTVIKNETLESRTAEFTVSYPGISADAKFSIVQAAGEAPAPEYDYEFDMTEFHAYYYDSFGNNGEINYYTWISDLPFSDDGYTQVGGNYYLFDIFAAPGSGYAIPVGTYTLGEPGATDAGTFTSDYSKYLFQGEDDLTTVSLKFTDGTLEVSADAGVYTFEAFLTDTEGKTHHVIYTGPAVVEEEPEPEPEPETPVIEEPINMEASLAFASYFDNTDEVMGVGFQFTDMEVDDDNYVIPPGTMLTVEAYMPYNEDGKLALGTYDVVDSYDEYSVATGWELFGYQLGSYAVNYPDAYSYAVGYITSGTMEITGSRDFDQYTISCDFVTAEGVSIKCTWSGTMTVSGMPGPESTLEGDYAMNLEGAAAVADFYGDYYGTGGGNWYVNIMPEGAGDAVAIDFVAEGLDFAAGIPTGTYKAAADEDPYPGEYAPGYRSSGSLYGSWYVGVGSDGYAESQAPAVSGDIDIVNNGDGTYDFTFNCEDGFGNTWSGSWSGSIDEMNDYSSSMYSASSATSRSSVKPGLRSGVSTVGERMTPEQKAELLKENGLKTPEVSAVQARSHKMSVRK